MRTALDRFRVAVALALVLAFGLPSQGFAEVAPRPTLPPATALGLEVGRPIEIDLPGGSRIRGKVLEVSDSAVVVEYQSASGTVERQTIAFSAMQAVAVPPKVDRWLDKYKWFFIIGTAVLVTVALLQAAGGR